MPALPPVAIKFNFDDNTIKVLSTWGEKSYVAKDCESLKSDLWYGMFPANEGIPTMWENALIKYLSEHKADYVKAKWMVGLNPFNPDPRDGEYVAMGVF